MDEIDAALDFRNVSIVANYIKDRTKNAQFIIISLRCEPYFISHFTGDLIISSDQSVLIIITATIWSFRNDMFEVSHRLIGIYKVANATKSESTSFIQSFEL